MIYIATMKLLIYTRKTIIYIEETVQIIAPLLLTLHVYTCTCILYILCTCIISLICTFCILVTTNTCSCIQLLMSVFANTMILYVLVID